MEGSAESNQNIEGSSGSERRSSNNVVGTERTERKGRLLLNRRARRSRRIPRIWEFMGPTRGYRWGQPLFTLDDIIRMSKEWMDPGKPKKIRHKDTIWEATQKKLKREIKRKLSKFKSFSLKYKNYLNMVKCTCVIKSLCGCISCLKCDSCISYKKVAASMANCFKRGFRNTFDVETTVDLALPLVHKLFDEDTTCDTASHFMPELFDEEVDDDC